MSAICSASGWNSLEDSPLARRKYARTIAYSYHCDGIFAPSAWRARLVSCRVVAGSRWAGLSDHNPVVAEFTT